ncbi:nitronate monooxygenase [Pseudooceanicola sp. CBS1P-1]|uniref:Nitronate monooxygenase n=1 Tax=Pseudooceanicola albus TaxID=2692189 RepID=A0A6L7GAY7_9RHOB|nr:MULTISPECIES: nitronate monooxygenase [Pseudooceanicola]MBT9387046.1 nitronate monooxygenase [Pseudooceanicola endophyticus]MXN21215.1 nitronate monooxygenase [Pseudooceanicola albus]
MLEKLGIALPILQAPMAGVSTPQLAAAVSNAGGLGAIGIGATDVAGAARMIAQTRQATDRPFNVNVFAHATPQADPEAERAWLAALRPLFAEFDAEPPAQLRTIYQSFNDSPEVLRLLLETRPAVVSFHFGLPAPQAVVALREAGITLLATATNLEEARRIQDAGIDGIVAQGMEAGGHRGVFDCSAFDPQLGTFALTRLLATKTDLPIIAAGGIMDGAGIAAAMALGASAAQLGTAFIDCPESNADAAYRQALHGPGGYRTRLTSAISGRPARALENRFTQAAENSLAGWPPAYPIAYDAGKALQAAAKAKGEHGFGAHWAGQGAPRARSLPATELVAVLMRELRSEHLTRRFGKT